MSERTKLDEIVDEELHRRELPLNPYVIEAAHRIAEKAFRHGVEQAKAKAIVWHSCKRGNAPGESREEKA